MVRVDYEPSDVLISLREPYNKKTIWIHPKSDNIEVKIYDKGWKIISQTKDTGLSEKSKNQIDEIFQGFQDLINGIIKKQFGKFTSSSNVLLERQKALESKIQQLEDKIDKMNKKYSIIKQ